MNDLRALFAWGEGNLNLLPDSNNLCAWTWYITDSLCFPCHPPFHSHDHAIQWMPSNLAGHVNYLVQLVCISYRQGKITGRKNEMLKTHWLKCKISLSTLNCFCCSFFSFTEPILQLMQFQYMSYSSLLIYVSNKLLDHWPWNAKFAMPFYTYQVKSCVVSTHIPGDQHGTQGFILF